MVRLADKDVTELKGLAERLSKGKASLNAARLGGTEGASKEMLKDLEVEREELKKEKAVIISNL